MLNPKYFDNEYIEKLKDEKEIIDALYFIKEWSTYAERYQDDYQTEFDEAFNIIENYILKGVKK